MLTVVVEYRILLNAPGSAALRANGCAIHSGRTLVWSLNLRCWEDIFLAEPSVIRGIEACPQCVWKTSKKTEDKI